MHPQVLVRQEGDSPRERSACGWRDRLISREDQALGPAAWAHAVDIDGARPHYHKRSTELYYVLEGSGTVQTFGGTRLGVAGAKGFGGGFAGRCGSDFGEPEMKAFIRTTSRIADRLGEVLRGLDCDVLVALTHYAPVPETLAGEPLEIYPFLGSYLLGQAIDSAPTALALHGHAHHGSERGTTPGGVRVRNVAHPVIKQAYSVFHVATADADALTATSRA